MQPNLFAVAPQKKKKKKKKRRKGCVPHQELGFGYLYLASTHSLILSLIAARSGGNIGGLRVR